MIRKSVLALAAVAALGLTAAGSTDALAKKGGWKGGGWHKHHIHKGYGFRHGFRFGVYPAYYDYDCYKVITPRGRIKIVCS